MAESRNWTTTEASTHVAFDTAFIQTETRTASPTFDVPDSIYSSLKYTSNIRLPEKSKSSGLIVAKLTVVFPDNGEEVTRADKAIIDGVTETTLKKKATDFEGAFRWKFTECSYHFGKRSFAFEVRFFTADNLTTPFMVMRSAPFLVYARKPSAPQTAATPSKKRKRTDLDNADEDLPTAKLMKLETSPSCVATPDDRSAELLTQFKQKLQEMLEIKEKLSFDDQQTVSGMVAEHFPSNELLSQFSHLLPQASLPFPSVSSPCMPEDFLNQVCTTPNLDNPHVSSFDFGLFDLDDVLQC